MAQFETRALLSRAWAVSVFAPGRVASLFGIDIKIKRFCRLTLLTNLLDPVSIKLTVHIN